MNNINYKILAIIFLAIIFICFGLFIITEKNEKNLIENRQLEKMPEFKIAKLDPFPNKFEAYFNDHFPFRSQIIKLFSKFTIKLLKKSPLENKVIIGNDNWLYMAGNYLDGYQGKSNFTKPELNSILKELEYRKSYCEERNIKFYFVIIPQKSTIYPEFIQKRYKCNNEYTPRTQLKEYLEKNNFPVCDITEFILQNKTKNNILFKKTDNHWNNLAGFYGTQCIIKYMSEDFPILKPLNINDYKTSTISTESGNIAQMINMKDEYSDYEVNFEKKEKSNAVDGKKFEYKVIQGFAYPWEYEIVKENKDINKLKVLFIRESFAVAQIDFYKECFGKSVFIFDAWQHKLNEPIIENEKPDIVVIQVVESLLHGLLKNQSRPLD